MFMFREHLIVWNDSLYSLSCGKWVLGIDGKVLRRCKEGYILKGDKSLSCYSGLPLILFSLFVNQYYYVRLRKLGLA